MIVGESVPRLTSKSEVACMKREMQSAQPETLLTPAEVAALFRVDPKTVTR